MLRTACLVDLMTKFQIIQTSYGLIMAFVSRFWLLFCIGLKLASHTDSSTQIKGIRK